MALPFSRRTLLALGAGLALAGCGSGGGWHSTVVRGATPDLAFRLDRAPDGAPVSAADFRGKLVMLYFGYTFCPDVCPTTLAHVAQVLKALGPSARDVRVLFVTVDSARDTLPVLAQYVAAFGPQFVGLRGDADALEAVARRYRVAYSVQPDRDPSRYAVTHSSAIYVFDRQGRARLLVTSLSGSEPDIAGTAADLRRLLAE